MTKDTNRNNLKHETKEWKKYRSYSLVTNAGWKGGEERKTLTFLSRTRTLDHRILRSEVLTHSYRFLVNEPRSTGSAGSSCIVLRSSMSKVSCLKIHSERKEISSSFVTKKKKIIFNQRPKKNKSFSSDQVKRQIRYQCWHVDKHNRPWGSLFIFPWGIYEAAAFLIPVSFASLVCMNYYTIIYGLSYCIQTQQ